jgi:hypothetical protein
MTCAICGNRSEGGERYCRQCGTEQRKNLVGPEGQRLSTVRNFDATTKLSKKDPDELISNGIGSMFMGDGFLMVSVILSVTQTSISSLLWLLLLIPAFFFFGKGFADILHAKQIQKRMGLARSQPELTPTTGTVVDVLHKCLSSDLTFPSSVAERTTRELK